ncbi:hypothetical protein HGA13_08400 [Nocardia speluncae]|uniref:Uncharacterized protein n=1 Tax=Nocardia speluncae TaxID=419477 RepID=A0A846XAP1_9NOCA|nr:hypothetical protein [Nocardia speluncae]NKY33088.1 hypothetical protein [Nocardia speluncae]
MIDAETTPTGRLRAYIRSNLEYVRAAPVRMTAVVEIVTSGGLAESDQQMLLPLGLAPQMFGRLLVGLVVVAAAIIPILLVAGLFTAASAPGAFGSSFR